ncbi:uncharacterized protein LOC115277947 isoform X2 [Suricata suricatta]|uniref:uncharacterized protein LOC115277947 isoform X2 n=1 Tax=Suricata suricatta TaxID=37032 RepID=UPI001156C0F0|nr:uncharacterized protein LOC115277947 isoform X2 [Suricata suricatta]
MGVCRSTPSPAPVLSGLWILALLDHPHPHLPQVWSLSLWFYPELRRERLEPGVSAAEVFCTSTSQFTVFVGSRVYGSSPQLEALGGEQNMTSPDMLLWPKDYFEMTAAEKQPSAVPCSPQHRTRLCKGAHFPLCQEGQNTRGRIIAHIPSNHRDTFRALDLRERRWAPTHLRITAKNIYTGCQRV